MKRLIKKIQSTRNVANLGRGLINRCKIILILCWHPLRRRLGYRDMSVVLNLQIKGQACDVHLNGSHDEFLILEEILSKEEYRVPVSCPEVIFDVGGNIGLSALFFALSHPSAKVYSFEPSPTTYQRLMQNVAQCKNIIPVQRALSGNNGQVIFYDYPSKSIASSLVDRGGGEKVTVVGSTLQEVMREFKVEHVDVLKFDIEGAEYDMFKNFDRYSEIGYLIGEVHEDLMGIPAEALFSSLRENFELQVTPAGKEGRFIIKGRNIFPNRPHEEG